MKRLSIFLIVIGILVSCSKTKKNDTNKEQIDAELNYEELLNYKRRDINPNHLNSLFRSYTRIDSIRVEELWDSIKLHMCYGEGPIYEINKTEFYNNIHQSDSISQLIMNLINQRSYGEIVKLYEFNLPNFYFHPFIYDSNLYQLHWALLPIYQIVFSNPITYYNKLIHLWEINRAICEAENIISGEINPNYESIMIELSILYDKAGENEKKKEIESILENIDFN